MADEQEEIWEANEADMDYRKMKQTHEVVKNKLYIRRNIQCHL